MSRENERAPWLVLAYRVPGDAVPLRMSVWRRLKAAAALVKCGEAFDSAAGADE